MQATILFGGDSRECLVSVASAQAIATALPEADLWFWQPDGQVRAADRAALLAHQRPFEIPFMASGRALGPVEAAVRLAATERRIFVLAMHGGSAENGAIQALCEAAGVPYTGSNASASRLAFDKVATKLAVGARHIAVPQSIALAELDEALARHGSLFAKPVKDGSSFGLMKILSPADLPALRAAAAEAEYLVEPMIVGAEATCGVLEYHGVTRALPPVEIIPADGSFDYHGKYLASDTQEICPARFGHEVNAAIMAAALVAHRTVGAGGYSRSDFVVTPSGPVFLEINTLPGLTKASLFPKALKAEGIAFADFLEGQIAQALARVGEHA